MAISTPLHLIHSYKSLFCTTHSKIFSSSLPNRQTLILSPPICKLTAHSKIFLKPLCKVTRTNYSSHRTSPKIPNKNLLSLLNKKKAHSRNGWLGWRLGSAEDDYEGGGDEEYEMDEEDDVEDKDRDNWNDEEIHYGINANGFSTAQSDSFVNTQGWETQTIIGHKINQDEFHKISLFDCDFFIRKVPDADDDVYDFREMYVTPPEMDVYSIPEVVGKMPKKYARLRKTDYGCYNVIELPIDRPRDPFAKTEFEVLKVFLMKHYKNKRADDSEFVLDFEEIYVIDSKTKSISRATVVVNVPGGKNRDRRNETLIVCDQGTSFKVIPSEKQDSSDVVIGKMQWEKTRKEMENYLRSFRDFETSNWF